MSATQHLIPNTPIYPSPPLTANHHERGAHLPDQNQNQAPKRIAEIPPHLVEIYMDPSAVKVPSSVLAAMNHVSQQHTPVSFARQAPPNGSGQSNKASLPPAPEQRKHLQRRPSPNQSVHFSYDGPHQPEPATPSEPRPPTQNRTQSDPNVYRDARHQPPPQSVLMQSAHPPPHHQLPRSHPHHQPHQPGPSQAQQAQQHQAALMRQQELKRLSLASAGAPPNLLPPASITSPTAAGAAPPPLVVNGNGPATAGPTSAHPDSHTPPHANGAPNSDQLVHTLIHHSAAQALAPVRPIFEQAWLETVTNVQREMGKMVTQFDDRYRGLEHDVNRLRGERNKAREEVNKMREELMRMGERCDRYKEERNKLKDELAHCGGILKSSSKDRQEMEAMRQEIFRLRSLLNDSREPVNQPPENMDNFPRRLSEESYDDVDESFRVGQARLEGREKQPSVPPKEEPSNMEAHAQFHLEMEKMKEQMREQMQREIQIQMKDMLEKGMRNSEGSSGSASPATARPREVSSPKEPTLERATPASSTRTSTTLPEASSDPKPDAEDMDVDRDESVASGSPESLPPADIETEFPSTMTLRGDQGRQPHANHASTTLTGPVLQSLPPPHPHSTVVPSQSHRPSSRISSESSPALIQGSLGRRGEGSDVSREMKEKYESVRPLTPSSPGSAFRAREIERPGSGLSGRGRSANSTPVMPYQSFTGAPSEQERRRGDSSSRSRPATPRSNTAPAGGLRSSETSPSSLPPPPPPPPQVPLNRPGSSSSSHRGASPGTPGPQFRKPYTAADGSPLGKPRNTRFSSPVPASDPESDGTMRKRGREEYEESSRGDAATSSHQRANTHPSDERARQRVKIEPTSDEQSRLRTLSPSSRAANTNGSRPSEHRGSWSHIVPENLPPLQSPSLADRKPIIHPPSGSKPTPTPTSATGSRPPNWDLRSPLSPPATVQVQHWATAPSSSQNQWRSEPRPGSSGGRTAVQFPFRKPLVTQNVNGQQQNRSPTSPSEGNGPSPKSKLSIKHLDLLYESIGEKYHCRVCRHPDSKDPQPPSTPPAVFPMKAGWPDLAGHYENAHPKSCEDLEKLSAAQVAELKQQLKSSRFCGFVLS